MKVVLFCGGQGTRLREYSEAVPKPMVPIGHRPILWHIMKYYAHFGHKDFVLCLGYKSAVIKDYFLKYEEWVSNDFVLSNGGRDVKLFNSDIHDWSITFVDTGMHTSIGQRLKAVEHYLDGEEVFLANYADGLTDLHLPTYLDSFLEQDTVGSFLAVRPPQSFHVVSIGTDGLASSIHPMGEAGLWVNGGFFAFKQEIFSHIGKGEDLVFEPFQRLIQLRQLSAYQYEGYWAVMDTFKDKQALDDLYEREEAPWELWKRRGNGPVLVPPEDSTSSARTG